MSELTGKDESALFAELRGVVYRDFTDEIGNGYIQWFFMESGRALKRFGLQLFFGGSL
jgi:hypothetical protein